MAEILVERVVVERPVEHLPPKLSSPLTGLFPLDGLQPHITKMGNPDKVMYQTLNFAPQGLESVIAGSVVQLAGYARIPPFQNKFPERNAVTIIEIQAKKPWTSEQLRHPDIGPILQFPATLGQGILEILKPHPLTNIEVVRWISFVSLERADNLLMHPYTEREFDSNGMSLSPEQYLQLLHTFFKTLKTLG